MKNNKKYKKIFIYSIIIILFLAIIYLGYLLLKNRNETITASENSHNMAFYELVD